MAAGFKQLPFIPLDQIMIANAQWPDFQREHPDAVNTTIGVLVDPHTGKIWRPEVVTQAVQDAAATIRDNTRYGYQPQVGNAFFLEQAAKLVFGHMPTQDLLAYQTLGGTGALSLLKDTLQGLCTVRQDGTLPLVLDSGWPNHPAIFGEPFALTTYAHLDAAGAYNHQAALEAIQSAPGEPVVLLQVCGYNDDGADRTKPQWDELLEAAAAKHATVVLDSAYLGLANGLDEDRYPIVRCVEKGLLTFVCFSASKNMGLYNERVGALFVVNASNVLGDEQTQNLSQLIARNVRRTVSTTPLLAAEAAALTLERTEYYEELEQMRLQLVKTRETFARIIGDAAPNIHSGRGLFTKLLPNGFTGKQLEYLGKHAIFALPNSRVNLGGLQAKQVERVATIMHQALDQH